jgi:hypothetical protein
VPLVHTTELRDGRVHTTSRYVAPLPRLTTRGPAVLLPRVGAPRQQKIAILPPSAEVALSDCVIALCCATAHDAEDVAALLRGDRWADVASLYGGTCARYIRVAVLQEWLTANGVRTEKLPPTSLPLLSAGDVR